MQKNKKVVYMTQNTLADHETGKVTSTSESKVIHLPSEPPYVKMYIDDLCLLADVAESLKKTLLVLLKKLDYEGYITLSPRFREATCKTLGVKDQTFRNYLRELVKKQMLVREGTNEYRVNPRYFARGDWRSVCEQRKSFEMRIKYTEKGREITTTRSEEQLGLDLNA